MLRVGHGFDAHRFAPDRPLVLGGIAIPHDRGLAGHSDADVVLHALIDAVLGALALGDIGRWFPPADPAYRNADSGDLLQHVLAHDSVKAWHLQNVDITVLAETPRLAPHIDAMRSRIADLCGRRSDTSGVSVKATTTEGMGFTGRGEGIAAFAVLTLVQ